MTLTLRWVGEEEFERVAETRMLSYAPGRNELPQYIERLRADRMTGPGDHLLAERDGLAVGTATQIPMHMWVRGGRVTCQGVAYVGAIRTARRKLSDESSGVGTEVMREVVRSARERGFVVSALMPYRASYYEHFGYGVVERRMEWTIPTSVLPTGPTGNIRYYRASDCDALAALRQRIAERGQCDIERHPYAWDRKIELSENGFFVVDREGDGPMRSATFFDHAHDQNLDTVRVIETLYEDVAALRRVLNFLGSLRDQYSFATLTTQRDFPLNLLLRETQMTHRASRNHPTAEARPYTRMQARVLDHEKLISAMNLPVDAPRGKIVVGIHEVEGTVSKLAVEVADGQARATPTDVAAQVEMPDRVWAMVALGDVPATSAAAMGLLGGGACDAAALRVLDVFSRGPAPFCYEYF